MRMADKKKQQKTKQKKNEEPKVKDLTKGAQAELGDKDLEGVSGGMVMSCSGRKRTCHSLVIIQLPAKSLTVFL
jgi:hypothetical protein